METGMSFSFTRILHKANYKLWKPSMESYFIAFDLWDIVFGASKKPPDDPSKKTKWNIKYGKTLFSIKQPVVDDMLLRMENAKSPTEPWDTFVFTQSDLNNRQRRWMEYIKDYDFLIKYHPGKANVVADALSRKTALVCFLAVESVWTDVFRDLDIHFQLLSDRVMLATMSAWEPELLGNVEDSQRNDPKLVRVIEHIDQRLEFRLIGRVLYYHDRLCVLDIRELKDKILADAHHSRYSIYPGSTKMYQNLKSYYWWNNMKKEIADYVSRCLMWQQIKAEHQKPSGLLHQLDIPHWKWEHITMDFIAGLPVTRRRGDSIWVIVDRLTKSAHFLPVSMRAGLDVLAKLYVDRIVSLHGVPTSIVSDRDPRFTSHFWKSLQQALGTKLSFSTAYHLQTDG
ncbi:hypothetical protein AAC387_Pa07g3155 [Persea americana]